jgi:CelD/BcsL family acetyltransferase involved in cellulose biosynthesis
LRVARWLGDHRQCFSSELLVDPRAPEAGTRVVDALLTVAHGLHLPARANGPMARAVRERAPWLEERPGSEGWITSVPVPRRDYVHRRIGEDDRRAVRRGAAIRVRTLSSPAEVAEALERLFVLHRERWRNRPGEISRFSTTERQRDWYRRAVGAMAERGHVRVAQVREDDALVASSLGLVAGRGGVSHTTACRPGGRLREPGHWSLFALLDAFEEAGAELADLGWGAAEPGSPKARVGPTQVLYPRFVAARSPAAQRALAALLGAREAARRLRRPA